MITSLTWDLLHTATSLLLLTAFRLWPLFCSVSTFTLQLFQILSVFRYHHQVPTQTRSHFPVHTYWAAAAREREGGGGEKGHEVGSYCLYKISFEHSKIWKTIRHHHQDVLSAWVLLSFPGKERFDAAIQQPNGQFFCYSKTNNQDGVNYSRGKIQDYPL